MQKEDRVQVAVHINGKQGINELGKLEMEANELRFAMKKMKKQSDEYVASTQKYNQVKNQIKKVRDELGLQGMTLQQLRRYHRDLTNQITTTTTKGTRQYEQLRQKLVAVNQQITRQRMEMRGATGLWSRLGKEVKQFGALALGYLGLTTLTSQLQNLIHRAGEFSDRLANVRKTTGLTAEEVQELNAELKAIDTRTARKELLSMAKIAGKLGITAKNDVLGFVAAADKINVALGEDLGDPAQSMRKLGKLIETFKVKEVYGIEDAMLKVGSAINHLGKSSTANEQFIVEFTKRMGGIAPLAKVTIQDILGLAAASDALGLTQEVSTTALSKLFIKMTSNREVFAEFTKDVDGNQLSLERFSHLIDNNFNEAFLSLLRGVKDNSQGMIALSETLTDLELDGGRVVQVLGTLSNNTKLIGEQQKIANVEFQKGTSVLNEFNLMNETLGAKLEKIRKAIFAKFVNSSFVQFLERMAGLLEDSIVPQADTAIDRTQKLRAEMSLEIEALKQGNFSADQRNRIIEELNQKYKDYLPRLISEKDTVQQLSDLQEQANRQLLGKILLMEREQEINHILKEQFQAQEALWAIEKDRQELLANPPQDDKALFDLRMKQLDQLEALNRQAIDINSRRLEESKQKFQEIAASMGTTIEDLMSKFSGSGSGVAPGSTDGSSAERKKSDIAGFLNGQIKRAFQEQTIALKNKRAEDLLTEEEYKSNLLALEITHLTAMIEVKKAFGEDAISEEEALADKKIEAIRRVEKVEQDAARKSAKTNKQRVVEIEEGIRALGSSMAGIFGSIASLSNETTEQGINNALRWSNAQVVASQASALASAIEGATRAAAAAGPGAPFVLAGYIASMVGTVLGAFGQIRQNQRSAQSARESLRDQDEYASQRSASRSGVGRFHGGDSPSEGLGFGDENGEFTGYTHANEFVVSEARMKRGPQVVLPSYTSAPSKVVDLNAINSTIASGFRFSGSSSTSLDSDSLSRMEEAANRQEQATKAFAEWVSVLLENPISAQIGNRQFEDGLDEYTRKEGNRSKGSLRG